MKATFRTPFLVGPLVVLTALSTTVNADLAPDDKYLPDPSVTIQLVSGLGAKKQIDVSRTWIEGSELLTRMSTIDAVIHATWDLDGVYSRDNQSYVYLRNAVFHRTDGVNLIIPWKLIKEATSTGKVQTLVLTDDTEHRGNFLSHIRDKNGKQYNLGTTSSMSVVSVTPGPGLEKKRKPTDEKKKEPSTWYLTLSGQDQHHKITNPRFEFLFSFQTWQNNFAFKELVTKTWSRSTENFSLIVDESESQGALSDFERVDLSVDKMTVTASDADSVSGTLVLYGKDSDDKRQKSNVWMFACDVPGGYTMVIPKPNCQLAKTK